MIAVVVVVVVDEAARLREPLDREGGPYYGTWAQTGTVSTSVTANCSQARANFLKRRGYNAVAAAVAVPEVAVDTAASRAGSDPGRWTRC